MATAARAWTFSIGEEDWGPVCLLEDESSTPGITILSEKNSFDPLLLIGPYKAQYGTDFGVKLKFDGDDESELSGGLSEYFGSIAVSIGLDQIDDLLRSDTLTITIKDQVQQTVDLRGAGIAVRAFLKCARR